MYVNETGKKERKNGAQTRVVYQPLGHTRTPQTHAYTYTKRMVPMISELRETPRYRRCSAKCVVDRVSSASAQVAAVSGRPQPQSPSRSTANVPASISLHAYTSRRSRSKPNGAYAHQLKRPTRAARADPPRICCVRCRARMHVKPDNTSAVGAMSTALAGPRNGDRKPAR
jgi:hypothetical protein